jgi:D-xylose transport system substrate-binding protein
MKRFSRFLVVLAVLAMVVVGFVGCTKKAKKDDGKIKIGFSMDTLMIERWLKDKETFIAVAKSLGADEVDVQAAESKAEVQNNQCENMITNGIDVLVVLPYDSDTTAAVVESAHKAGVKVIAYDRMINKSDVDYYVSYDNVKIGEMEADPLVKMAPKGNYVLLGGAPTDSTSRLLREGQMKVLQPYIQKGDIKIVADQWVKDWLPEEALKIVENALTANKNNIQAIVASNDGTAGGAIQALAEQKLAGKVAIGGQDVELASCQRIVEGTQTASVYASPILEATAAAEAAVKLAKGQALTTTGTVNNGTKDIPSILLAPILVMKDNMMGTVIKDGFHKLEEVYKNIPKDKWPKQ